MTSGDFDELNDPLERLELNEKQGLQAFRHVLISIVAMMVAAIVVTTLTDLSSTECPDTGDLCTSLPRVELVLFPTLVGFILSLVSMWRTYDRWRKHIRWRPWLFATYAMWIATTGGLLLTSSIAFVEIG